MMKRQTTHIVLVMFLFALAGCAMTGTQAVTPVDRALVYSNQYLSLEQTYKSHYSASSSEERENLSKNVAPILDRMRFLVIEYSKLAMSGTDDVGTRLEIVQLGRTAALHLTREISK